MVNTWRLPDAAAATIPTMSTPKVTVHTQDNPITASTVPAATNRMAIRIREDSLIQALGTNPPRNGRAMTLAAAGAAKSLPAMSPSISTTIRVTSSNPLSDPAYMISSFAYLRSYASRSIVRGLGSFGVRYAKTLSIDGRALAQRTT